METSFSAKNQAEGSDSLFVGILGRQEMQMKVGVA
jgi:hypothetical protein